MGAPVLNGPFAMPMFRDFVPRALQPWIYIFMAATFQLSGGIYLGALNEMIGGMALMREDLMMCLYANLAGMAIYFPILFRMKFRFTNRTLLTAAAAGALVCNLVAPHGGCCRCCGPYASWRACARYRVHSSACRPYSCGLRRNVTSRPSSPCFIS